MLCCEPFTVADISPLLLLAEGEGWLCDRWEFEFLLQCFPQGCFICREEGNALGYVTSISYGRSGWIGNLMVHPEARRRGIGKNLMLAATSALQRNGVETVWLTASEQGAGLYRKLGFTAVDIVNRWTGKATLKTPVKSAPFDIESVRAVDRMGWGDWREALLRVTCDRGLLHTSSSGFLCCQEWKVGTQIGPWGSLTGSQAGQLLDQTLTTGDENIFLDVPAGNLVATSLLNKRGFSFKGGNILMYLGATPLYHPGNIYALASMGSMG
jgi:GNAT superfamily N-acetyltransferase